MDELHKIAMAYYDSASKDIKQLAKDFFNAMDKNKNKEVTLSEFLAFMTKEGYQRMSNREFFTKLNSGKDGALRFRDVMTLYYIINSGRPFCDGCGEFIEGMYFTCTRCFKPDSTSFNVCPTCFCDKKDYVHDHREFLDNFALLAAKRIESQANTAGTTTSFSPWNALTPRRGSKSEAIVPSNPSNPSNAIVPVNNRQHGKGKWMTALVKAVDMGLSAGNIASNLCSIL